MANKAMVVPAILASTIEDYNRQIEQTVKFAARVSLDFTDGEFTTARTINLIQSHWPETITVDMHLMYRRPLEQLETVISLKPRLVVIHVEAEGDLPKMISELQAASINAGVALLQTSAVADQAALIQLADHALVFSGSLGSFGGQFDAAQLAKVAQLRQLKPALEISWDGGVTPDNIAQIAAADVDVINSGGFIQNASDPAAAYQQLTTALGAAP